MASLDLTLNGTLEIDDDTWYETLEAFDGDEDAAREELVSDLTYDDLSSMYGRAWLCDVYPSDGWVTAPGKDKRPL